ncbi:hypothetical protein FISHEDRAFT_50852 [Fistulina hepatica ATCC 64428]|uniref:Fatty acid hydroxylase domain-containing protein n=1 Tax=Fistulina hepatica ATCC 64428 TaxID=1128425 RepID=A0A0D7A4A4_9AGAR|nr:hypothetical protein FISHEDRAFT_50852 [Fistulina hepatica ATCC 64428]
MNATGAALHLYDGVDFTSLTWLEHKWVDWYIYMGNPVIATGLMSFLLHEIVYFGRCIPWIFVDAIPYFRRWKLQPTKIPTAAEQWECTKMVLFSHATVELPAIWLFHPVADSIGMATYQVPFPSWQTMAPQILLFFVFEDTFHFLGMYGSPHTYYAFSLEVPIAHSALHRGVLYKHIHKVHHTYPAPFGLAAEFAHPAEVFILGAGTIIGPLIYCYLTQNLHIFTVYVWITLRLFQAVDAHSGYGTYFPWSLHNIIPFWAGADHHDFHHMAFSNNFATSFRWWDWLFGTDTKYRAFRKKVKATKAAMKGATSAQLLEVEKKLQNAAEAEGAAEEALVVKSAAF